MLWLTNFPSNGGSGRRRRHLSELPELSAFQVPRCLRYPDPKEIQLHVSSDASKHAYATAAHLVCQYSDRSPTSRLIASKSRLAPLKVISMGAVLSTRQAKGITQVLSVSKSVFWTDSSNVCHWARNTSRNFKPFVVNRISEIHDTTDPEQWRHVPGEVNPADLPTRGV